MEPSTIGFIVSCVVFFGGFIVYHLNKKKHNK